VIPDLPDGAVVVVFHSRRTDGDSASYADMAERMDSLAREQPGFLGVRSVRDPLTGEGITVSYWRDDASARAWKQNAEHREAQRRGREEWYADYSTVVASVDRRYSRSAE